MFGTWLRPSARYRRRNQRARHTIRLPRLEALEDRLAPATHTWTGGASGLWSNNANWTTTSTAGDVGADLVFPGGAANYTNTNDISNLTIGSITFSGTNSYTIGGSAITLGSGGVVLDSTVTAGTD